MFVCFVLKSHLLFKKGNSGSLKNCLSAPDRIPSRSSVLLPASMSVEIEVAGSMNGIHKPGDFLRTTVWYGNCNCRDVSMFLPKVAGISGD